MTKHTDTAKFKVLKKMVQHNEPFPQHVARGAIGGLLQAVEDLERDLREAYRTMEKLRCQK